MHRFPGCSKATLVGSHQCRGCFDFLNQFVAETMIDIQFERRHGAPVIIETDAVSQVLRFCCFVQVVVVGIVEEQICHSRSLIILIQMATGEIAFNQPITLFQKCIDLLLPGTEISTIILQQGCKHGAHCLRLLFSQLNQPIERLGIVVDDVMGRIPSFLQHASKCIVRNA